MTTKNRDLHIGEAREGQLTKKEKRDAYVRLILGQAYSFLRSRKTTSLAQFTLDAAIQDRIDEIQGKDGEQGLLSDLDAMEAGLNSVAEMLRDG